MFRGALQLKATFLPLNYKKSKLEAFRTLEFLIDGFINSPFQNEDSCFKYFMYNLHAGILRT